MFYFRFFSGCLATVLGASSAAAATATPAAAAATAAAISAPEEDITVQSSRKDLKLLIGEKAPVVFTVDRYGIRRQEQLHLSYEIYFSRSKTTSQLLLSFNTTEPDVIRPVDPVEVDKSHSKVRVLVRAEGAGKTVLCADADPRDGEVETEATGDPR